MEERQRLHITKHLPELLRCTRVEVGLLAHLQSRDILSDDEVDALQLDRYTGSQKAQLLYRIVMTKYNAYQSLKEALRETKNSGAAVILDEYCYQEYSFPYKRVITCYEGSIYRQGETLWQFLLGKFEEREVTVKKCSIDRVNTKRVWAEVELLMQLDWHDNIVRYFKTEMSDGYILIALEYCKINLADWLSQSPKPLEIDVDAEEIIKQMLNGMEYLHTVKTIHGNLNPKSILLTNPDRNIFRVKISDFALSSTVLESTRKDIHPTEFMPMGWSAPEVVIEFEKNKPANGQNIVLTSFAADVFSLGCIFHFVLTNGDHHPFGRDDGRVRNKKIVNGNRSNIRIQLLQSNQDTRFAELICKMTENSEYDRPLASDIHSEYSSWSSSSSS